MTDPNVTTPDETPDGPYTPVPGPAQPAEGTVVAPDSSADVDVDPQETAVDGDSEGTKEVTDDVVDALLQGKYSTDAAEQRRRLSEAGYDPEAVKEAVQKRLAQRYQ